MTDQEIDEVVSAVRRAFEFHVLSGSRYICCPPVLTTDADIFVYSPDGKGSDTLRELGFEPQEIPENPAAEDYEFDDAFRSWRKGRVNAILCNDGIFYEACRKATEIATQFNIRSRDDRVVLFRIIREAARRNRDDVLMRELRFDEA